MQNKLSHNPYKSVLFQKIVLRGRMVRSLLRPNCQTPLAIFPTFSLSSPLCSPSLLHPVIIPVVPLFILIPIPGHLEGNTREDNLESKNEVPKEKHMASLSSKES